MSITIDPILTEFCEGTSTDAGTLTVLWKGESLALIKSKAGKSYDGRYRSATVQLVLHGHGHMGGRMRPYHLCEHVWTCDRKRESPADRTGRLTQAVIDRIIEDAKSYEADTWPTILAERLEAERQRKEAKEAARKAEEARAGQYAASATALEALAGAALDGDAIAILQAAQAYRELRQAQEAA
jgi:hypothetical protein